MFYQLWYLFVCLFYFVCFDNLILSKYIQYYRTIKYAFMNIESSNYLDKIY